MGWGPVATPAFLFGEISRVLWHTVTYVLLTLATMSNQIRPPDADYFTTEQVAALLGKHPVSVRRWRSLNKKIGLIKHGPPYEFRGANVVYPKDKFHQWCTQLRVVDGVPRINLPVSANIPLPAEPEQRHAVTADEVADE